MVVLRRTGTRRRRRRHAPEAHLVLQVLFEVVGWPRRPRRRRTGRLGRRPVALARGYVVPGAHRRPGPRLLIWRELGVADVVGGRSAGILLLGRQAVVGGRLRNGRPVSLVRVLNVGLRSRGVRALVLLAGRVKGHLLAGRGHHARVALVPVHVRRRIAALRSHRRMAHTTTTIGLTTGWTWRHRNVLLTWNDQRRINTSPKPSKTLIPTVEFATRSCVWGI